MKGVFVSRAGGPAACRLPVSLCVLLALCGSGCCLFRLPASPRRAVAKSKTSPGRGDRLNSVGLALFLFPVACPSFPMLLFRNKLSTTAYGHSSMLKTIKFESKSIKKATFSVKKGSKRRAFRHAHLNILGVDPLWR